MKIKSKISPDYGKVDKVEIKNNKPISREIWEAKLNKNGLMFDIEGRVVKLKP